MATSEQFLLPMSGQRLASSMRVAIASLALQDWIVGAYLAFLCGGAAIGSGPLATTSLVRMGVLLVAYGAAMVLVRGRLIGDRVAAGLLYRVAIFGSVQLSYFWLRDLLRAASTYSYDEALHHVDRRLFGVEPSLWAERFVGRVTTEWFAFFYFSYFLVLAIHILPMLFLCRRKPLLEEFGLTMLTVYCVAQAMYLLVPAYGPHRSLAGLFTVELPTGFWYRTVLATVHSGGAERDAFPSLHAAGPAAIALFSFRHRREVPFNYTWSVTAFFTINIIVATVFLRWHYLIDVVAGLLLAGVTLAGAAVVSRHEAQRRRKAGLADMWPPYRAAADGP